MPKTPWRNAFVDRCHGYDIRATTAKGDSAKEQGYQQFAASIHAESKGLQQVEDEEYYGGIDHQIPD
jgi:hypothetical protein